MQKSIIDTHIHIWDLEQARYSWLDNDPSILNRTYHFEELLPAFKEAKITGGVLVQAANTLEDSALMLKAAKHFDEIIGVVAWLPLLDPEETFRVLTEQYSKEKYFKGVRHLIHNEPNANWLLQEQVLESLKLLADNNIPYDVVGINNDHLETVIKVAEKIPNLKMVLDHLNQPPIASKQKFGEWGSLLKTLSQHENVYAKISGQGTASGNFEGWIAEDIQEYIGYALDTFGAQKCFCGGDWPVSLLSGSYIKHWNIYQNILASFLNDVDQQMVLSKNAMRFYNL